MKVFFEKSFFLSFFKQEQIVFMNWEKRESQVKMFSICESQVKMDEIFKQGPTKERICENYSR